MAYFPNSGSVLAFQGTDPWKITGSVQASLTPAANQSVSGVVGASVLGTVPVVQSGTVITSIAGIPQVEVIGSVATSITPVANQSVSGVVGASIIGVAVGTAGHLKTGNIAANTGLDDSESNTQQLFSTNDGSGAIWNRVSPFVFNGTNWDRLRGNSSIGALVSTGKSSVITVQTGTVISSISGTVLVDVIGSVLTVGGTIGSVSGTVGASVIGTVPVVQSGTVITSISGIVQASVQGNVGIVGSVITVGGAAGTQYLEGAVQSSVTGNAIIFRSSDNSSVLTTVSPIQPLPVVGSVSGVIGASIIGLAPVNISNTNINVSGSVAAWLQSTNASVITVGTAAPNQSVSGTVGASIIGTVPVIQSGTVITSVSGAVDTELPAAAALSDTTANPTTPMIGAAMMRWDNNASVWSRSIVASVAGQVGASIIGLTPVNISNTNINVSGSVVGFQGGGWTSSLVSTVPSSVIVGASIFGLAPVNVTNTNLNVGGSVLSFQAGTVITSIVGAYSEDSAHTSADTGIFVLGVRNDTVASFMSANLEYGPLAVDSAGRNLMKPFAADESRVEGVASVVSAASVLLVAAAGAGLRNYITDFMISNTGSVSTLVTFTDGSASVLGKTIAPAGGGSNAIGMATPIRTNANSAFNVVPGTATSVLHATVYGYKAP